MLMVKQAYKIPTNIHNSRLDNEIRLSTNDNSLESKPISLRSLMIYILSGFALAWTMKNTFMVHAMLPVQILFGLVWVLITYLLGRYEKTKELGYMRVIGLFEYLNPARRRVPPRLSDDADLFANLIGVDVLEEEVLGHKQLFLKMQDGSVGIVYRVVGSGSVLLFEDDKNRILTETANYYAKLKPEWTHWKLTSHEAQKVDTQLEAVRMKRTWWDEELDKDILERLDEQEAILKEVVGAKPFINI